MIDQGDLKGAMALINVGLNKDPDDMEAIMAASRVMSREFCWGMSLNLLRLVKTRYHGPDLLNNLGMALSSLASSTGNDTLLDEAESHLRKAHRKASVGKEFPPKFRAAILANLALIMLHKVRLDEAEKYANDCLALDPDNESARETLGYAKLHRGDWVPGFGNYEWTLGGKYRKLPKGKYWEVGERGKKLLVRGEQGIGDEISYASVLPQASKDNSITYECDRRLEGLMKRSLPGVTIRSERQADPSADFDAVCLVGSLCMEYRKTDADFPRDGYLIADPERREQWRVLLDKLPGRKVGIAWTGGLDNTFKHRRSFNLEALLPILKTPGITWVSLQYNDPTDQIAELKEKHGIEIKHWSRAVEKGVDYDETAALMAELDCVVATTTAVVHLAGAINKKCFVLVPKRNRWWYSSDTSAHRWYGSLELFRQQDKWPVEKLAERLKAWLEPEMIEAGGCAPPVYAHSVLR